MDLIGAVRKHLEQASPDLLHEMVTIFAELLMSADADAACNAAYGERSAERTNGVYRGSDEGGNPLDAPGLVL